MNGENILLKEMQDKMIQQEGLCGSIKLQLSQDRIQVWVVKISLKDIISQGIIPVIWVYDPGKKSQTQLQHHSHNTANEPIRSFDVKLYSRRIGASGVEHTINFGDEGMDINARKSPTKSLMNRLTPIKHKLNTLIYVSWPFSTNFFLMWANSVSRYDRSFGINWLQKWKIHANDWVSNDVKIRAS